MSRRGRHPALRLRVHVEGQTEESFVNQVLAPHLYQRGYVSVWASFIGSPRRRGGGITSWNVARREILRHLKADVGCFATTMVDYYGLPRTWPGRSTAPQRPLPERANLVETTLLADVSQRMGCSFNSDRFVPYLMMHEFEAMLFSDCHRFADAIGRPNLASDLQGIRDQFANPEEIDDSPRTAPSKRIEGLVAGYQKPLSGTQAALAIGLDAIRAACPHFHAWLQRLECLPAHVPSVNGAAGRLGRHNGVSG